MAIDDMTNGDPLTKGSKLQKKNRKTLKHLARSGQLTDVRAVALKKLTEKRARASPARLTKKKFVCPFCQRRFLTRGNIKNHIRIHTRDKPFHCPLCKVRSIALSRVGKLISASLVRISSLILVFISVI